MNIWCYESVIPTNPSIKESEVIILINKTNE